MIAALMERALYSASAVASSRLHRPLQRRELALARAAPLTSRPASRARCARVRRAEALRLRAHLARVRRRRSSCRPASDRRSSRRPSCRRAARRSRAASASGSVGSPESVVDRRRVREHHRVAVVVRRSTDRRRRTPPSRLRSSTGRRSWHVRERRHAERRVVEDRVAVGVVHADTQTVTLQRPRFTAPTFVRQLRRELLRCRARPTLMPS